MKRLIAILLSLTMICCLAASMAETAQEPAQEQQGLQNFGTISVNGIYALTGQIPEGYQVTLETAETGLLHGSLLNSDSAKPALAFTIIFDETYADVQRMNDLSQEDLNFLESTFEDPEKEVTYTETAYGTKLMCVSTKVESWDYLSILTIYKGYMIELNMFAGPGSDGRLTEEQKQIAIDFLSNMNFEAMTGAEAQAAEEQAVAAEKEAGASEEKPAD